MIINSLLVENLKNKAVCQRYILSEIIGKGTYGVVYKAVDLQNTNLMVAVKVVSRSHFLQNKCEYLVDNEIEALQMLESPNIVKYIDHQKTENNYYIVMELCNFETLAYRLKLEVRFEEKLAYEYLGQILNGIQELHCKGVVHRDLKLDNINFLNEQLKIMDFGFSKLYDQPKFLKEQLTKTFLGTSIYIAPEVLAMSPYIAIQADMYSLGVILYLMLFGIPPYAIQNMITIGNQEQIDLIKSENMKLDFEGINVSQRSKELLKRMLKFNPLERITYPELYNHPYIKNLGQVDIYKDKGSIGLVINVNESITMYQGLEQKLIHPEKLESNPEQLQQYYIKHYFILQRNPSLQQSIPPEHDDELKTVELNMPVGAMCRQANTIWRQKQASMIQYSCRQLYEKNLKFYLGYMHQIITLKVDVGEVPYKDYSLGLLLTKMYRECQSCLNGLKEKQNVFKINNWQLVDEQYHIQLIKHFEDYLVTLQANVEFLIPDYKELSQYNGITNQLVEYLGNTQVGVQEFEKIFQDSFKAYYKEMKGHIFENEQCDDLQHLYLTLLYIMDIYNTDKVYRKTVNEEFKFEEYQNQIQEICNDQENWKEKLFNLIFHHPNKECLEKD